MKHLFTISVCLLLLAASQFAKAQTCHAGVITAPHDTVCTGTPAQLTVTGSSGNIQWQSAIADTFTNINGATDTSLRTLPLVETTYFRVVVSTGSCADTSTAVIVVVPAPIVIHIKYKAYGDSVVFNTDSTGDITGYRWSFGDGDTSNLADPSHVFSNVNGATTFLYVCVNAYTNTYGCSYTFCIYFELPGINAVRPVSANQQSLIVYPNPCTECEIKGIENPNDLLVTDLLGRVIPVSFSKQSNGYRLNFPFSGMYLVKNIKTGEVVKVVKE